MATIAERLARVADRSTGTLVHYGRKSGKPYEVTIWFMVDGEIMYLGTANQTRQWVRNLRARPDLRFRVGDETFTGQATEVHDATQLDRASALIEDKYWYIRPLFWIARLVGRHTHPDATFRVQLSS